jgi:hypothetical protein
LSPHNHPCNAIAALGCLFDFECLLENARILNGAQSLDSPDASSFKRRDGRQTGEDRLPIELNGASTALPKTPAVFGTVEA